VSRIGRVSRVPPDVVLLDASWPSRALIRAQLIANGFEVAATDTWAGMRRWLRPGTKPRVAIVDLKNLENPAAMLRDLSVLMRPQRVLVIAAAGTVPGAEIERLGFRVLSRPVSVEDIVNGADEIVRSTSKTD
jgi:hypothetical protein